MPEPPAGAPPFTPHRAAYRELLEGLWYASELFRDEGDGGIQGSMTACHAVARYIAVRHENPELAAPFLTILKAFEDLENGINSELFSTDTKPLARSRSSLRKHLQLLAAVCMEALMRQGDSISSASAFVANKVSRWSQLRNQAVTAETVENWREACRRPSDSRHQQFDEMVATLIADSDPRKKVDDLLASPPGVPAS